MGAPGSVNERWARNLAARLLPGQPFRWEIYDRLLREILAGASLWLDLGAGASDFTFEHSDLCRGVGVDLHAPDNPAGPFVAADLRALPFRDRAAGALALRFVVEHLAAPEEAWRECERVLAPGGRLLVITTNRRSPVVAMARLVPSALRQRLIARLFRVPAENVLPTFHRWNTPARLAVAPEGFDLERLEFVEALDWSRRWLFRLLLGLALILRPRGLAHFRSNILAVYRKRFAEVS